VEAIDSNPCGVKPGGSVEGVEKMQGDTVHWIRRRKAPEMPKRSQVNRSRAVVDTVEDEAIPVLPEGKENRGGTQLGKACPWDSPDDLKDTLLPRKPSGRCGKHTASERVVPQHPEQVEGDASSHRQGLHGRADSKEDSAGGGRGQLIRKVGGNTKKGGVGQGPWQKRPAVVNWLLGGIRSAAGVATVSPSYAREVRLGCSKIIEVLAHGQASLILLW
jgi:hypothetical protein